MKPLQIGARVFTLALVVSAFTPVQAGQSSSTFDLIVRRGMVIDGSGGRRFRADVGVTAGRIAAIGDLSARKATEELDARGLFVTPGFINLHSHAES